MKTLTPGFTKTKRKKSYKTTQLNNQKPPKPQKTLFALPIIKTETAKYLKNPLHTSQTDRSFISCSYSNLRISTTPRDIGTTFFL